MLWYGLGFAVLLTVGVVSLLPAPDLAESVSDKSLHFVTYACLAAGFASLVRASTSLVYVAVGLVTYGLLIEILQGMTGYRVAEWGDVVANSIGVVVGQFAWWSPLPARLRRLEARWDKS
jgi:VanZ family protein